MKQGEGMSKLKAFGVLNIHDDMGVVVFHETAGKAKVFAWGHDDNLSFTDEYTDLRARREKWGTGRT